jgi:hypothetical protein
MFCKLAAALCVIAVMSFTGLLAYHVAVSPLPGIFAQIIPVPAHLRDSPALTQASKKTGAPQAPDIDPGEKTFQKAHELLALGKLPEAREKLTTVVQVFPSSASAPTARRIAGEMNLDELLSPSHMDGKQIHVVKRGDSYLSIAAQYKTTIDCIMCLNSMMELHRIQPRDELVVMPLDYRLLIEPRRNALSLWDDGRFIREYPILAIGTSFARPHPKTTILNKSGEHDGHRVLPQAKEYRSSDKVIQLAKPSIQIRGWDGIGIQPAGAILLSIQDIEEITLLTRTGNEVEFR